MSGTKNTTKKNKDPLQTQITIVMGIVIKNKKVLMTKRFEEECPDAHLKWELPGGKIKFGEEPKVAIEREIYEETGIIVKAENLVPIVRTCVWNYTTGIRQHTILLAFDCSYIGEDQQEAKDHHVESFEWKNISELTKIDILPGDLDFIREVI